MCGIMVLFQRIRNGLLLCPFFKKGDPTNIDNYRGISLLSLPGNIFTIVLRHGLQEWAEDLLLGGSVAFERADLAMMPFPALMA